MKKAIELSVICNQDIEMAISDKDKTEIILYRGSDEFHYLNPNQIKEESRSNKNPEEFYTNDHYDEIAKEDIRKYVCYGSILKKRIQKGIEKLESEERAIASFLGETTAV